MTCHSSSRYYMTLWGAIDVTGTIKFDVDRVVGSPIDPAGSGPVDTAGVINPCDWSKLLLLDVDTIMEM